jgi:hypothetical protein
MKLLGYYIVKVENFSVNRTLQSLRFTHNCRQIANNLDEGEGG